MKNQVYRFQLMLTSKECREYYQGLYTSIKVRSDIGKTLQFPAQYIRPFITSSGVSGVFEIYLDDNNKFIDLRKIG